MLSITFRSSDENFFPHSGKFYKKPVREGSNQWRGNPLVDAVPGENIISHMEITNNLKWAQTPDNRSDNTVLFRNFVQARVYLPYKFDFFFKFSPTRGHHRGKTWESI